MKESRLKDDDSSLLSFKWLASSEEEDQCIPMYTNVYQATITMFHESSDGNKCANGDLKCLFILVHTSTKLSIWMQLFWNIKLYVTFIYIKSK
jgi:hypothetical protein